LWSDFPVEETAPGAILAQGEKRIAKSEERRAKRNGEGEDLKSQFVALLFHFNSRSSSLLFAFS
jgi:hypothetical protein